MLFEPLVLLLFFSSNDVIISTWIWKSCCIYFRAIPIPSPFTALPKLQMVIEGKKKSEEKIRFILHPSSLVTLQNGKKVVKGR